MPAVRSITARVRRRPGAFLFLMAFSPDRGQDRDAVAAWKIRQPGGRAELTKVRRR